MEDLQGGTLALEHRYDLERRSGEYALFTLYGGVQHPFERPVWVKVYSAPAEFKTPAAYERLKRSVLRAAEFEHVGVASVVDFGDIDTHLPFVVCERPSGVSLDEYLDRQGTLPPDEALEIIRRVAEIVAAAHEAGLVHGGIAPRWITVADHGVFVDHFALQPAMSEIRSMEAAILSADLLWALPPEQFEDEAVELDERSDVWGLGVLLYWMLSGVHPYFDEPTDTSDGILRLRSGSRAQALEDLAVEADISSVVEKALAVDPADRYRSVAELIKALGVDEGPSAPVPPSAKSESKPAPSTRPEPSGQGGLGTAIAVLAVLLVVTNLAWLFYGTASEPEGARTAQSLPAQPSVLPVGVELRTDPPSAKVFRVDGAKEKEFGDTPMVLDPKAIGGGKLTVVVRKVGFQDAHLDVLPTTDGRAIVVHLQKKE